MSVSFLTLKIKLMLQYSLSTIKLLLGLSFVWFLTIPVKAQLVPDKSLGSDPSIVVPNQTVKELPSSVISGGSIRGSTLFHSLQEFNVNDGQGAFFINPTGIENILTRVTGGNSSTIQGTLGVLGPANLFLLNPKGIIFTPGARLDLSGSFLATTATSFEFPDGNQFSTAPPQPSPLLTISIPTKLNFTGGSPGSIVVQGPGHSLASSNNFYIGAGASTTGLRVQPGRSIALIGGDVVIDGGIVTAPVGRIEVGSVGSGNVGLESTSSAMKLNYIAAKVSRIIELTNSGLIDTSGPGSGGITLQGGQIDLSGASYLLEQSQGASTPGSIDVNATGSLVLQGNIINQNSLNPLLSSKARTGIASQAIAGEGANINISAKKYTS